jgi:hypothetical protein
MVTVLRKKGLAAILAFTVTSTIVAVAQTTPDDPQPLQDVMFDGSGDTPIDRMIAERATVFLTDLQRVSIVSLEAEKSMVDATPYSKPVGMRVPTGTVKGSRVWMESPLIRVDTAQISVRLIDDGDGPGKPFVIQAGYQYPASPDDKRTPWLLWNAPLETEGLPLECDFVVRSGLEAASVALLEVAAIDSDRVYFKAASVDAETGSVGGDEFLVAADYSIAKGRPGSETRDRAGFRDGKAASTTRERP